MYQYTDFDKAFVKQRADQFRDQLQRWQAGKLTEDDFRPLRLQNGWYVQRYAPMLRVAVPYGEIASRQLRVLAQIAREYDEPEAAVFTSNPAKCREATSKSRMEGSSSTTTMDASIGLLMLPSIPLLSSCFLRMFCNLLRKSLQIFTHRREPDSDAADVWASAPVSPRSGRRSARFSVRFSNGASDADVLSWLTDSLKGFDCHGALENGCCRSENRRFLRLWLGCSGMIPLYIRFGLYIRSIGRTIKYWISRRGTR